MILWPGRPEDNNGAKAEIGSFASVYVEEVKGKLPPEAWPWARDKALEKARHVRRYSRKARRPGAVFLDCWRQTLASYKPP